MFSRLLPLLAAPLLLFACDARFGNDAAPVAENATAAGRAEPGRVTIEAPGFNMSIAIPEGVRSHMDADENGLIYPGSDFGGVHVQGGPEDEAGARHGEVELSFTTADPVDRVAAWYRDPARAEAMTIGTAVRDGAGFRIEGTGRRDGERFTVRLAPRPAGGTDGRLLLADSH